MEIGSGIDSPAIEQDPSVAQLQAQAQSINVASLIGLPETGFVGSLNALSGLLTIQAGSSSPGVTVVVGSDGVSVLSIGVLGITAPGTAKSNISTLPPTPSNDEFEGYAVFSLWLNTTVPNFYMCADASTGAAVWVLLG